MMRTASLFSQLLSLFDHVKFSALHRKQGAKRYSKGFSCWDLLVAMLFCHLAQAKSLREICGDWPRHWGSSDTWMTGDKHLFPLATIKIPVLPQ